ncbi:sugar phosphate nucleotidyltransferase [Thermospira aquatica]|uniref:NTP transferase domain-containing protein n=1 Tax=Thermospira aquatica TaxID=2828656 RepID=A0AAX3BFL9_9SPIR|nr:sugar phosphate nucleotidyltransferase [Thermospira aquatica]URA10923.1 NTP transferase domain-containing protein [Thermospira aquatica]
MKIIIPVAGVGSRLRPHTHVTPKSLIRVAGKPIIDYILSQCLTLNFSDIIFIIGHLGDQIKSFIKSHYNFSMKFVRQTEFKGLGHAIYQARNLFDQDEDVVILLGDIIFNAHLSSIVGTKDNMIGVMEVTDPRRFGVVMQDENGYVTNLIEKPENPPSNTVIGGVYYFKSAHALFEAIRYLFDHDITTKNEYQLTDAIKRLMYTGEKVKTFSISDWYDCGEKEALLETNEHLLKKVNLQVRIPGSIVIPPVYIHESVEITNSIIGPNVSISEGCVIKNAIISHSIIGSDATVENAILTRSLIGDNAYLYEAPREMNIGPDSEIASSR